ncbi:MAG TPA: DUF4907 domain-containing protein [Bacteroidia bacterium]|nr:DUF4907 domain-containing protein [Bacteroidia bacterium]
MTLFRSFLVVPVFGFFLLSCGETKDKSTTDSVNPGTPAPVGSQTPAAPSVSSSQNIEAKTFEVIDSLGKKQGWGYDLYIDGKRTIHQPIFPGLPGNNSFQSEGDAMKMGQLAANRMKSTGTFPTVVANDFDSMGTKLPKNLQYIIDTTLAKEKIKHGK